MPVVNAARSSKIDVLRVTAATACVMSCSPLLSSNVLGYGNHLPRGSGGKVVLMPTTVPRLIRVAESGYVSERGDVDTNYGQIIGNVVIRIL